MDNAISEKQMSGRDTRSNAQNVPQVTADWSTGVMRGMPVQETVKTIGELQGLFRQAAGAQIDPVSEVYRVRWWPTVAPGEPGGLFWGVTILQPGKVGDEFFMTFGHFHADRTRAEYYATAAGQGILLRMDAQRATWGEAMSAGSLHYICGSHAHRVVNTGDKPLIFWACWGSDAGYDYGTIREHGFGARVIARNNEPVLVANE